MKRENRNPMKITVRLACLAILGSSVPTALAQHPKEAVDYVSPNIGGVGQLLTATIPYVQRPHGMARLAPGITDRYLADKIYGFPAGPALLMASVCETGTGPEAYASAYDHDFETATPYYYEADLQSWGIRAEFTAAKQAAYYRFTFPASAHAHFALTMVDHAEFTVVSDTAIEGSERADGIVIHLEQNSPETREYFYAEFSRPLRTWQQAELGHNQKQFGDRIGFVSDAASIAGEVVEVKEQDAEYFTKLAHNYENVFNPALGFMAPKSADGAWVSNFDPDLGGGNGGRDYFTEVNAWLYTFHVQYDVAGLIRLFGGRDAFNVKLDRLFVEQYGTSKFAFLGQFPNATGLVGQYAQGNEPSFHVPYLYDFSGQPWKTQQRVRQLMDIWYGDGPLGIPGDDDGGALSSWYVLNAMGFYPVCPGSPVYEIGSPIFERTTLRMGNGKLFTIVANHVSARNKYIQSAQLNSKPLNRPWFHHSDITDGGTLVLEMADHPNLQWGSAPQDAPPSMITEQPGAE